MFNVEEWLREHVTKGDDSLVRDVCAKCGIDTFLAFHRRGPHTLRLLCRDCGAWHTMKDWSHNPGRPVVQVPLEILVQYPDRSIRALSRKYMYSESTIRNRLAEMGVDTTVTRGMGGIDNAAKARARRSEKSEDLALKVRELWLRGLANIEIARRTGISRTTITKALRALPEYSEVESRRRGHEIRVKGKSDEG
jgi:ribosomal protein S27AE